MFIFLSIIISVIIIILSAFCLKNKKCITDLETLNSSLRAENNTLSEKCTELEDSLSAEILNASSLEKENSDYYNAIRNHSDTIARLQLQIGSLTLSVNSLSKKLSEVESLKLSLEENNEDLKKRVEYLNRENQKLHQNGTRNNSVRNDDYSRISSFEKQNKRLSSESKDKDIELSQLHSELSDLNAQLSACKKNLSNANKTIDDLMDKKMFVDDVDNLPEVIHLREVLFHQDNIIIELHRDHAWGSLFKSHGSIYEHLTPEQQALVNYPPLDKNCVFYARYSKSYHSVEWCYTLKKSEDIDCISFDDAIKKQLKPCSKCVDPNQVSDR